MALTPLSLRAYAAHRKSLGLSGGTLPAVRKAIARGRLVESLVTIAGVKKVADPEWADREWLANTDPGRSPLEEDEEEDREPSELVQASTREKQAKAGIAELRYRKEAGELVDAADVRAATAEMCATVRNKVLGVTSRMKQAHPELTLEQLATLDTYLREALEELAAEPSEEAA